MKSANGIGLGLLGCLLAGCASDTGRHTAIGQAGDREATVLSIEKKIARRVRGSGEWEMSQFRSYQRADLDGDEVSDTVLLTTFERGNAWRRELLVCLSSAPGKVMVKPLGGKGERMAETIQIEGRRIIVKGKSYAESDPMCCPSLPYQEDYAISNGVIVSSEQEVSAVSRFR